MAMFRKLKLVSEEELARLKQRQLEQYEPKLRSMARIQNQVENLLSSSDESLTSNERLRLLEMLQQRFREMKPTTTEARKEQKYDDDELARVVQEEGIAPVAKAEARDVLPEAVEAEPTKPPEVSIAPSLLSNTILGTIAKGKKKEAREVLDKISKYPSLLSFNNNLEVVVNNEVIPGSNFIELFKSIFSAKGKSASLVGFEKFQNALGNIELYKPSASSASPSLSSRLRSSSSLVSSSSQNPPPGDKPDVLHVYKLD